MHSERPFFRGLVKFMTEGPIIVMALEREDAVKGLREVMGATNPANAAEGTIRKRFAANIERNCIHGSDAPETAAVELRSSSAPRNCCKDSHQRDHTRTDRLAILGHYDGNQSRYCRGSGAGRAAGGDGPERDFRSE